MNINDGQYRYRRKTRQRSAPLMGFLGSLVDRLAGESKRTAGASARSESTPASRRTSASHRPVFFTGAERHAKPVQSVVQGYSPPSRNIVQLHLDVPLLLVVITLLIVGIVMVYSASYDYSQQWYGNSSTIFIRQLVWLGLGCVGAIILAFIDYHWWKPLALFIMGITILLLLAVLFTNQILNGAARTLFGGSIQPSELAKLATIIYLSVWLYSKQDQLSDVGFGLFPLAGILGLIGGLIISQPDLSAVITICFLGGLLFFLAGGDLKQIILLIGFAMLVGYGVVAVSPTGSSRLSDYFNGLMDPTQGSYHVRRSFDAFVKGGWLGVGIGNAEVKLTGLPVPPTDSIFAVVGEELGVIGSIGLIALYIVFLWRGLFIARNAPDQLGSLMVAGLTLWICMEAFVNMAVMVNLLPFAGNALPFISAGGSSMVITMAAVGIMMSVSRLSVKSRERNEIFVGR